MATFMVEVAYTPAAWASIVKTPQNRLEAVRPAVERLGGKVEAGWLTFGDYDIIVITQMPDNTSAAAFSIAVSAGGAVKACKTTPLLTLEEGAEAIRKASGTGYRPPGG